MLGGGSRGVIPDRGGRPLPLPCASYIGAVSRETTAGGRLANRGARRTSPTHRPPLVEGPPSPVRVMVLRPVAGITWGLVTSRPECTPVRGLPWRWPRTDHGDRHHCCG